MWDMLLSFLPIMLVILGILIVSIVTLKLFEAQQKKGDIDGLIIDSRKT